MERTLAIIKPDATERGLHSKIIQRILDEGFEIVGMKLNRLSPLAAEGFYAEHRERPFFKDLVEFMLSGPVVLLALERAEAISHWRGVMGATNPEQADDGTIRAEIGENIERNSVHGSDSRDSAQREVAYFFNCFELV
jgi:nucleoside-diphosphate kinase